MSIYKSVFQSNDYTYLCFASYNVSNATASCKQVGKSDIARREMKNYAGARIMINHFVIDLRTSGGYLSYIVQYKKNAYNLVREFFKNSQALQ